MSAGFSIKGPTDVGKKKEKKKQFQSKNIWIQ